MQAGRRCSGAAAALPLLLRQPHSRLPLVASSAVYRHAAPAARRPLHSLLRSSLHSSPPAVPAPQGTADAVRQYMWLFDEACRDGVEDFLILSGG